MQRKPTTHNSKLNPTIMWEKLERWTLRCNG